jgi:hypothetical protein
MLELRPSQDGSYGVAPVQAFEQRADEEAQLTSLAFNPDHAHLACATEAGQ